MSRRTGLALALGILAGCGGGGDESPTYSRAQVRDAFRAEGISLREVGAESRSNQGFWILVFESPEEAQARANLYEGSGTLVTPEIAYHAANIVVYTADQRLSGPVSEKVEAALARLSET
jgi:hypothetical protein